MGDLWKTVGCGLAAIALAACTSSEIDPNAFYGDLSEAQQEKYLSALVAQFNATENKSEGSIPVVVTGDAKRGVITSTGTYKKVVTAKRLNKAKAAIAKVKAKVATCFQPEIRTLTRYGIGFQAVMKDPAGTVLYESEVCEGAPFSPRPYAEQTAEQKAYSLSNIAAGLEAMSRAEVSHLSSDVKITYSGDPKTSAIYGKYAFLKPLNKEDRARVKQTYGNVKGEPEICSGGEIGELKKYGLHFEYRIVDHKDQDIVAPWVCPANNTVALSPAPKLRGQTASR